MLKKFKHMVLALLLIIATSGITLTLHYCGSELIATSVNKEAKTCCDGTGGCCENKTLHFEVEDDYIGPGHIKSLENIELDILFPVLIVLNFEFQLKEATSVKIYPDASPPLTISIRLSLLQTYLC